MIELTRHKDDKDFKIRVNPHSISRVEPGSHGGSVLHMTNDDFIIVTEKPDEVNKLDREDFRERTKHLTPFWPP